MKIGTVINIEIMDAGLNKTLKYRSKVVEENDKYLFIDYPINLKTGKSAYLPKNKNLIITYVDEKQTIYSFCSEMVAKATLPIPSLVIKIPEKDRVKRIQRREYVRINSTVDVSVHSTNESFSPFATVTQDISGGGMSVVLPNQAKFEKEEIIEVWMVLRMESEQYVYIAAQAEVIRIVAVENAVKTASLKFVNLDNAKRQKIIRFCFEEQRKERKKELL